MRKVLITNLIIAVCLICSCGKVKQDMSIPDNSANNKDSVTKNESITKKGKFDYDIIADSIKRSKKVYETDSVLIYRDTVYNVNFGKNLMLNVNIYKTVDLREPGIKEKITKIELTDEGNKIFQTVNSNDSEWFAYVNTDDYNFDGFKDLYIHDGCAVLGNCIGLIMLYNSSENKFIREKEFDEMTTISLYKNKELLSSLNRSAAGACFTVGLYKYINSKLTLIDEEEQSNEYNSKTKSYKYRYIRKKHNPNTGKTVIVENSLSSEPKLEGSILKEIESE